MTAATPNMRQRLEAILLSPPCPSMTLDRLYALLPDHTHQQVRDGLNYLRKLGRIVQHGTTARPVYQGVMGIQPEMAKPAIKPDPPQRAVIWPAGLQVQTAPTSAHLTAGGTWSGVNWAQSIQRPGCQDHLQHPSRRGDRLVPPQGLISGCVGDLRDKRSNGR